MGFFTKDTKGRERGSSDEANRAARRVGTLPNHELVPWAETCLYNIGRNLIDFTKEDDLYALAEATSSVETLQVVMDEINARRITDA